MHDPPLDSSDPKIEADEMLKHGLADLARTDWEATFRIFGRPSDGHVRRVAAAALTRIKELESETQRLRQLLLEIADEIEADTGTSGAAKWAEEIRRKAGDE